MTVTVIVVSRSGDKTSAWTVSLSRPGVILSRWMAELSDTGSIQTVCQIPVVGV